MLSLGNVKERSTQSSVAKENQERKNAMKHLTKTLSILLACLMLASTCFALVGCGNGNDNSAEIAALSQNVDDLKVSIENSNEKDAISKLEKQIADLQNALIPGDEPAPIAPAPLLAHDYGEECFEKIKYIDKMISDRDCFAGENFKFCVQWIKWNLIEAGYSEDEIVEQDFVVTKYFPADKLEESLSAAKSYVTDGKLYQRSGRNYVESAEGTYVKADVTLSNIVVVKKGKSDKQIIIGAHYDGDGTGDNGSGIALALTTAQKVHDVETPNTLVFIFFNAEEYGCYGSTAYAKSMSAEEIAKTLYMINLDSLVCGDYCNLYGGVQNDEKKTVEKTEAFDNAMKVAESIGLKFETNPWTYEHPAPGYDTPDYASPSTGDWSDHAGFAAVGVTYLYFEATNWFIPGPYKEYDGYGETYLIGMLMNTKNDYFDYIEAYFPGRILHHITQFSALMNALVLQEDYGK